MPTPAAQLREARDLWNDPVSFDAALAWRVRAAGEALGYLFPRWSDLPQRCRRDIAETMLEEAVGRERMRRAA